MAGSQIDSLIQHLRRTVLRWDGAGLTDGQLLERFLTTREEAAFEALVRRHGPMVLGVCLRILRNRHDAEDAFQATFLVLVRKAASVSPREAVGNWLYGVAQTTALRAKAAQARRRERQVRNMPEPEVAQTDLWRDLAPLLDEELARLPDKFRTALVLCDLEGRPRKDVARQLKIPEGTLSSRLTTARKMLAKRLTRHGLAVAGGSLTIVFGHHTVSAGVPEVLVSSTVKAAMMVAAGKTALGLISAQVATLTEGVMKTMFLTKLRFTLAVVLLAIAAVSGGWGLVCRMQAAEPADEKPKATVSPTATATPIPEAKKPATTGTWVKLIDKSTMTLRIEAGQVSLLADGPSSKITFSGGHVSTEGRTMYGFFEALQFTSSNANLRMPGLLPFAFRFQVEGDSLTIEDFKCEQTQKSLREALSGRYNKADATAGTRQSQ